MWTIRFLIEFFRLIKYTHILNDAYDKDRLVEKLSYSLDVQFKRGPFAQLYAIINPYIKNGKYSPEQIVELNERGAEDDSEWMKKWVFERLGLIRNFITTQNLLDVLTYSMDEIKDSNYLFVMKPINLPETQRKFRNCIIELIILIILVVIFLLKFQY